MPIVLFSLIFMFSSIGRVAACLQEKFIYFILQTKIYYCPHSFKTKTMSIADISIASSSFIPNPTMFHAVEKNSDPRRNLLLKMIQDLISRQITCIDSIPQ